MIFKKLIEPLQFWLLSQRRCVGCGKDLKDAPRKQVKGKTLAYCNCKRVYVVEGEGSYRRALVNELAS
ncbi:hypothetical protein COU89_00705 [Candidatus Roizmanbacteria bacterium CG10_big_fil_rev_8_21_14_0_10_45_7]|uniref:Uncharacterized protein n=1 Tax=Candidatus Roizmanbacteria bacterium CG10_big_fil_rev_8_21_14_0_10_45_7 TaxID=1974854 RepID=A0A2M8KVH8_9BACT|nr:MAG: hypothetical protein COU89_00705 [Candidatus Roizmanbacteria bacterium CG10_big_fil_rev_8_21_14_0_10_45_7]